MKISEQWLRQWANPNNTAEQLGEQLTMAGLELDGMDTVAPSFHGVVVGKVVTCEPHPDADKLRVTTVDIGTNDMLQIVCGAPNVRPNLKVAVATIGAVLPSEDTKGFKIKKGKLRGVESYGMLCGASELGLVDEIDGLLELADDAPIGMDIRHYLNLDAHIFDVAITPNRGDCLSVLGLAREICAINQLSLNRPQITAPTPTLDQKPIAQVTATNACPRYLVQYIGNINRDIATPKWLSDNLLASGLRTHNFLVDVTNFVLLELGQPLHAFDADKIIGTITVRLAHPNETLELLNEQTITLTGDELVIADEAGALALAGIMGGSRSAVSDTTKNIILESAYFDPLAIAGRARRFGLHTDASQRFERGVDFELAPHALHRATSLIAQIAQGNVGHITTVEHTNYLPQRLPISISLHKINQLLGAKIDANTAVDILNRLEIKTQQQDDLLICQPPSHRFDITIAEDIVEEVARIYGYANIQSTLPEFAVDMRYDDTNLAHELKLKLANSGYFEAISFSFSDAKVEHLFDDDKLGSILPLANPISSELAVMRRTLLSSLLPIVTYNLNRQQHHLRFFEIGLSFVGDTVQDLIQTPSLAMVATGKADEVHNHQVTDFFDFKRDIESLLPTNLNQTQIRYTRSDLAFLHPGQSANLLINNDNIGWFGQLHPSIAKALDLNTVWVAQLNLEKLLQPHSPSTIQTPSKFPSVRRDLAFLVDSKLTWQEMAEDIWQVAGDYLIDLNLFDVYQGDNLPNHKKSLAFAMILQNANATLDDEVIKSIMEKVIDAMTQKHHAQLRDG